MATERDAVRIRSADQPPPDAAARAAALDPSQSFIVQAPAGSGKTTLLTQRHLVLLAHAERPEEIVAITFTRKAAAEMRHRILESLRRASRHEVEKDASDRQSLALARAVLARSDALGWALLDHPSRLRVQTIDSLNQWLAQRLPVLSGAGTAPSVHDRPSELYAEAAARVVAQLERDDVLADRLATVLLHLDNDTAYLQRLLAEMLTKRDHWLRHVASGGLERGPEVRAALEASIAARVAEALQRLRGLVPASLATRLVDLCRGASQRLAAGEDGAAWDCLCELHALPDAAPEALVRWQRLAELLLTKEGQWRRKVDKNQGFPPTEKTAKQAFVELLADLGGVPSLCDALAATRELPPCTYGDEQWAVLDALLDVLLAAAAELQLVFGERGQVDFVAVSRAALQALGEADEPSDLALALDYRIRHVLVDEFQDTSLAQVELLKRLTAGWERGDGRTLFCVGDPMQSIYRFREADVALFLQIRNAGLGHVQPRSLVLEANFRSHTGVVEWVNEAFAQVMPSADDVERGAVSYARSIAMRGAGPEPAVLCHGLPRADAALEAARIADLVSAERARNPDASIAILGRARTHLVPVARALQAAGQRYQGLDLVPLADRLAVLDVVSLTRALAHLADRTAWLACLRAPWCGLDLAALHALAGDSPQTPVLDLLRDVARLDRLSPSARIRTERFLAVAEAALGDRGRRSLAATVEAAWIELGGPATLAAAEDLDDVGAYLERLDRAERAGDLDDPAALEELLAELYAAPDAAADDKLQLLTIHRAKGLEWDVVIVAGLGRHTAGERSQLLRWLAFDRPDGTQGLVLAPLKARSADGDALEAWLRRLDGERAAHELGRLLYVAATRARQRLHLVAHLEPIDEARAPGEFKQPRKRTALAALWSAVGEDVLAGAVEASGPAAGTHGGRESTPPNGPSPADDARVGERPAEPAPPTVPRVRLQRLPDDWTTPPAEDRVPAAPERLAGLAPEELAFEWVTAAGRYAGTVVHEELERAGRVGLDALAAELAARVPLWHRRLRELGLAEERLDEMTARIRRALATTIGCPRGRWLFDSAHRDAQSELALTARLGREIVVVAIDRTFVDAAGVRWIVDFKTSSHDGADLDGFLDRERQRHAVQLERYAAVLALREPSREIRLGLYFPLHAGWREWRSGEAVAG
jgi:ATP-dependent helicase/nuclease subunit A